MRKEQKQYDRQFKLEAVEYFLSQDKSARKIAEHFGVCVKTFYSWIREYKENGTNSDIKAAKNTLIVGLEGLAHISYQG